MYRLKLFFVILIVVVPLNGCSGGGGENGVSQNDTISTTPTNNIQPIDTLTVEVEVDPVWEDATDSLKPTDTNDQGSQVFYLLWDRSIPMKGYIHKTNRDNMFALQEIHGSLLNVSSQVYAGSGISIECKDAVLDVPFNCRSSLSTRDFFTVGDSQIELQSAVDGLKDGSIVGLALISDLMATIEGRIGPTALLEYFKGKAPNLLEYFKEGGIHMAILGVRPKYWGAHPGNCPAPPGELGCWFHEGQKRWIPLEEPVHRPIYILVIGRSIDEKDDSKGKNPVAMITEKVEQTLGHFDVKSEVLTHGALGTQTGFYWNPPQKKDIERQNISYHPELGWYSCLAGREINLTAKFEEDGVSINRKTLIKQTDSEIFHDLKTSSGSGLRLKLDCKQVFNMNNREKEEMCNNEEMVKPELSEVILTLNYNESSEHDWGTWSSLRERAGSTLNLTRFIDDLRPDHYKATISPFPPLSCNRG